jgi:hypothetical protein
LNLDVVNVSDVKKDNQEENEINLIEEKKESIDSKNIVDVKQKRTGLFAKIGDLVQKAIDCCKE